jgi:uncharacterized UBP type Zn finger protein
MYINDRAQFESTAQFWTETYAKEKSENENNNEAVLRLIDMGFPKVLYF